VIENLLKPGRIGKLELKNRIIYSGITFKVGDNHGHLTEPEVESMCYRAKQEYSPAMITFPGLNGSMFNKVRSVNINTDEAMYTLENQVAKVKINDTKAMAILGILGRNDAEGYTLGASNIKYPTLTKEMSLEQIKKYVKEFGRLASQAKNAGFDAIRVQTGTPKKMLTYFVSPYTNQRSDQYGGSTQNRVRLVKEVLEEVRVNVGDKLALILELRMEENFYGGICLDEGLRMAELLAPYIDAFEPSIGKYGKVLDDCEAYFAPYGGIIEVTKLLREYLPNIMLISSGKMGNPQIADKALKENATDFIALARPLLADPAWITKMAKGEEKSVTRCIGCMNCFTEERREEIYPACHRACTVNPGNLRENTFYELRPADPVRKILIIGGGLAGMEAASVLAQRGHNVTLCEKNRRLGGQWFIASYAKEKSDYRTLLTSKINALYDNSVDVRLNTEVDEKFILEFQPEVTILATGAVPKELPDDIVLAGTKVVQGNDIILDQVKTGRRIVVIGGRYIGMEVAIKLAKEGKQVFLVDQTDFGQGANSVFVKHYMEEMIKHHIFFYPNCPVSRLTPKGAEIMHSSGLVMLEADTIILAIGTKSEDRLKLILEKGGFRYCQIGDCKRIGDALYAIRDAAEIARLI